MRRSLLFVLALFILNTGFAAVVDTVSIFSNAMGIQKKCVVITPGKKKKKKSGRYPVVYLLHGYSGDYSNWVKNVPQLIQYADEFRVIIVCPDGDYGSWYIDSPVDSAMKYETYISLEVPAYIDAHYPTIKQRNARAITGLSMGGHGAMLIALRHSGFFGAAGSISGVLDISALPTEYELIKRIGDTVKYAARWKEFSVYTAVDAYKKGLTGQGTKTDSLSIIFDCGQDDVFFPLNRKLHVKMLQLKLPHDYIERPGNHNWSYWANAVGYQLLFFRKYFDRVNRQW